MIFGIGYGWNREEMAQHGTRYGDRREILRDRILAMKALWTDDEATYDAQHVTIESSWAWPKPTQQPHPPIVLGRDPQSIELGVFNPHPTRPSSSRSPRRD